MISYIHRWAEIYVSNPHFWKVMPGWFFEIVSWAGRIRTQWRLGRKFLDVERAAAHIAPRPLLMIHGEKDNYIGPSIARALFAQAREPKELWIVPKAKHNRCRVVDPAGYRERVEGFFRRYAPRRPTPAPTPASPDDQEVAMAQGHGG
jgi:pimeloyl-ACP methyl ester carboxylesterase